jgi:uncharacterized protein YciI
MAAWIYFIHPPRDDFADTMTDAEREVWEQHVAYLTQLLEQGSLVLAGPTLGRTNTGVSVFEAPDEAAAQAIIDADPVARSGFAEVELRPFRVGFLRGRD